MVARQHPGEAMAEWFMEGFLDRLTDPHDAASMRVLESAVFYVVRGLISIMYRHCLALSRVDQRIPQVPTNIGCSACRAAA